MCVNVCIGGVKSGSEDRKVKAKDCCCYVACCCCKRGELRSKGWRVWYIINRNKQNKHKIGRRKKEKRISFKYNTGEGKSILAMMMTEYLREKKIFYFVIVKKCSVGGFLFYQISTESQHSTSSLHIARPESTNKKSSYVNRTFGTRGQYGCFWAGTIFFHPKHAAHKDRGHALVLIHHFPSRVSHSHSCYLPHKSFLSSVAIAIDCVGNNTCVCLFIYFRRLLSQRPDVFVTPAFPMIC